MELEQVFDQLSTLREQLEFNGGFGEIAFSNFSVSVSENTQQSMDLEGEIRHILP